VASLNKSDVCVVIPAYNEAVRIGSVVKAARDRGFPVVVADDGSSDGTAAAARAAGAEVLEAEKNGGKGAAIRRGIRRALEMGCAAAIFMDADGQHDPNDLERFLQALSSDRYEVVVGDRMREASKMPFVRRVTNRTMSAMISALARQRIPDTQCGYRALKRRALATIPLYSDRFEIETELLLEASRLGFEIGSLPVRCLYADEKSKIRPVRDTCRFFRFLFVHRYLFR